MSSFATTPSSSIAMTDPFQHQPLDGSRREIRLIKLFPKAQWTKYSLPTCSVFHASIDECPPYIALSYVWGDKCDPRKIIVNGGTLEVTKNLFEALVEIVDSEPMVIWIDAICINQEDEDEKRWQVALMGDIYGKTTKVLAWLGPSDETSDRVMDHMNILGAVAQACGLPFDAGPCWQIWKEMMRAWPNDWNPFEAASDSKSWPTDLHKLKFLLHVIGGLRCHEYLIPLADLDRLFRRSWWGRIWVLQEISLPAQAQFVCGKKRISRPIFHAAFSAYSALKEALVMRLRQDQRLSNYQVELLSIKLERIALMSSLPDAYQTKRCSLIHILMASNTKGPGCDDEWVRPCLDATDPRDKIFALLSLIKDNDELKKSGVYPDYRKSKEEIYTTVMVAMFNQGHNFLLSQACGVRRPDQLPSWVPDWSKVTLVTLQIFDSGYFHPEPPFYACGRENTIKYEFKDHKMLVRGTICDEIILSPKHVDRVSGLNKCASPLIWLYAIVQLNWLVRISNPDCTFSLEAAARVLHAGMKYNKGGVLERAHHFPLTMGFLETLTVNGVQVHKFLELQEAIEQSLSIDQARDFVKEEAREIQDILRASDGRLPFVTLKGRIGICSSDVKRGDVIALISGMETPFVLRPIDGKFIIFSEAYVDGIMDGEAVEDGEWGYVELI